jgi:lariat debranching enzyme
MTGTSDRNERAEQSAGAAAGTSGNGNSGESTTGSRMVETTNPDEINIDDDFDDEPVTTEASIPLDAPNNNPDEITISDDDFDDPNGDAETVVLKVPAKTSEAAKALDVDESADFVEEAREAGDEEAAQGVIGTTGPSPQTADVVPSQPGGSFTGKTTRFLALDKCGAGKDFIQVRSTLSV